MTNKNRKPLNTKEKEHIKVLRASGMSYHAISKEVSRDPKTVKTACIEPEMSQEIQKIRKELSEIYEELSRRMIDSITDEDIQKINAYQRTVSSGIATDKMRLLRNESTENVAIKTVIDIPDEYK